MPPATTPHDALFRAILSEGPRPAAVLRAHLPAPIARRLSEDPPELLEGTFIDEELRNSQSDRLFRVSLRDGRPAFIYTLLEHKSAPDPQTPLQLLRYMTRIWEQYADPVSGRLPTIIPMVFYQGTAPWRVPRSVVGALDADAAIRAELRDLRYILVDLTRVADADLAQEPEAWAGLMALKYAFRPDGVQRLGDILRGLGGDTLLDAQILRYIVTSFRDMTPERLRAAVRDVKPALEYEMATLAEQWLEEGRLEGRQEGRQEGLSEGEARGKMAAVMLALRTRFHQIDSDIERRIRATPADRLDALLQRALTAESLAEVLAADD